MELVPRAVSCCLAPWLYANIRGQREFLEDANWEEKCRQRGGPRWYYRFQEQLYGRKTKRGTITTKRRKRHETTGRVYMISDVNWSGNELEIIRRLITRR